MHKHNLSLSLYGCACTHVTVYQDIRDKYHDKYGTTVTVIKFLPPPPRPPSSPASAPLYLIAHSKHYPHSDPSQTNLSLYPSHPAWAEAPSPHQSLAALRHRSLGLPSSVSAPNARATRFSWTFAPPLCHPAPERSPAAGWRGGRGSWRWRRPLWPPRPQCCWCAGGLGLLRSSDRRPGRQRKWRSG